MQQGITYQAKGEGERIYLMTVDSWFLNIPDRVKFQCFKELATVQFTPKLNIKSKEQVAKDHEKANQKKKKGKISSKKNVDSFDAYYLNVAEELNDFEEWCISEQGIWGVPIPYFVRSDTHEVLCDGEIARHVAEVFRKNGGSDAWYSLPVIDLLPPRYKDQSAFLKKGSEIFDVWFENSLSWDFVLRRDAHSDNLVTHQIQE